MREITANPKLTIPLGRQGENASVKVKFPISGWGDLYGNGSFELINVRPSENTPYTCSITIDDDFVDWVVQSADVALVGHGKCELTYVVDGTVAKSLTFATCVMESIEGSGTVPAPYESRIQDLIEASAHITVEADRAEDAANAAWVSATNAENAAESVLGLTADATVSNTVGTPAVTVDVTVEDDHKKMSFAFSNLKGEQGEQGEQGIQGEKGETGDPAPESAVVPAVNAWLETNVSEVAEAASPVIDEWLGENVAQETGYVLDSSLTLNNAAPPAGLIGVFKDSTNQILETGEISSKIISGKRGADGGLVTDSTRCTTYVTYQLTEGDIISISDVDSGYKCAIAGVRNGRYVFDSGWQTSKYSHTVISADEGLYFVNIAKSDGATAISPSDFSTLQITISQQNCITEFKTQRVNSYRKNLLGRNIGFLYPAKIKQGERIVISTADGSTVSTDIRIYYYDAQKQLINYNNLPAGSSFVALTMVYDGVCYIKQSSNAGVPLQVEIGNSKTDFEEYIENVTEQNSVEWAKQSSRKGSFTIDSKNQMAGGTFDANIGYYDLYNRCHQKDIYIPAYKGDIVKASSSSHNVLVAVVDNPLGKTILESTGWKQQIDITVEHEGYYCFLASTGVESFDGEYTVIPFAFNNNNVVDDTFAPEVEATVASVRSLQTEPSIVFPLITDLHYGLSENGNYHLFEQKTIHNMKAVVSQLRTDLTVCLGDISEGNTSDTVAHETKINNLLRDLGAPYLLAIGNHDDNRYTYGSTFTESEIYAYLSAFVENSVVYNVGTNGRDYYYDLPTYKTRFIVLDANTVGNYGFPQACVDWFSNTALDTPDDYLAVVLTHISPVSAQNYDNTSVPNGSYISDAIIAYQTSGKPIVQFYGHSHVDVDFDTPYLSIATNCAKFENTNGDPTKWPEGAVKPARVVGEVSEDCWDMVVIRPLSRKIDCVRFGAGSDRSFTY